jgi:hypothetical protein
MALEFDFGKLVNALTNNNQAHLPPNDVFRMGQVVGYDPHFVDGSHSYPMLSVQLAGDEAPMHGFRFAESYVPNVGDTVFVVLSGEDGWIIASLAGAEKDNIGQIRSPSSIVGVVTSNTGSTLTVGTGPSTPLPISEATFTTPYLPNRIYRIEGTISFTVTNVATGGGTISGGGSSGSTATITSTGNYPVSTGTPTAVSFVGHWNYDGNNPSQIIVNVGDPTEITSMIALAGSPVIIGPNINNPTTVASVSGSVITLSQSVSPTYGAGATMAWGSTAKPIAPGFYGGYAPTDGSTAAVPYTYTVLNNQVSATGNVTFPAVSGGTFNASPYYSEVALLVKSPNITTGSVSSPSYLEMARLDVTGITGTETLSMNGFTTYWYTPGSSVSPNSWTQTFNWQLCAKPISNTSASFPVIHIKSSHFIAYDCGVAS